MKDFHYSVIDGMPKSARYCCPLLIAFLCFLVIPVNPLWAEQSTLPEATGRVVTHPGLGSAVEAASADDSLVLLILEMTGCRGCKRLHDETLGSPEFLNKAGSLHIVAININEQQRYASDFQVRKVPDLILMNAEGQTVNRAQGFMDTKELLEILAEARRNKLNGKWLGSEEVATIESEQNIKELILLLGSSNPLARARASELLAQSNKEITAPLLIKALSNPYLGIRVGARELLSSWAPNAPEFDPWSKKEIRDEQSDDIAAWWKETGTLPDVSSGAEALDIPKLRSVEEAISVIEKNDPARLSIASAKLREIGKSCLPLLRSAIERNSAENRHETVRILESIRWSIIIPDDLERTVRARHSLAWGASEERLDAIIRLGSGGDGATTVLAELANDPDPLVRESVAHALGQIGNKEALDALAVLLKSKDSNTRMVAAQELGKTENVLAGPYLSTVVIDPDELVACVAISAMEECKAVKQAPELLDTLNDPRWRVRAAGAQALGKLNYKDSADQLITLLHDEDPFVLKTALEALIKLHALPEAKEIEPLYEKHPDLATTITQALLTNKGKVVPEILIKVLSNSTLVVKRDIVATLSEEGLETQMNLPEWQQLVETIIDSEEDVRFQLVQFLENCPSNFAAKFLKRLLADPVGRIREKAAYLTLQITKHHRGVGYAHGIPEFGILSPDNKEEKAKPDESQALSREEVAAMHKQWHELLLPILDESPSFTTGLAYWLTGNGTEGLEQLSVILQGEISSFDQKLMKDENLADLLVKRLPWPEGEIFMDNVLQFPGFYVTITQAAYNNKTDKQGLRNYLGEPQHIISLFKGPADESIEQALYPVLGDKSSSLFLGTDTERNRLILNEMIKSGSPWAKAAAVICLAQYTDEDSQKTLEAALEDSDQWVRYAAIQALVIRSPGQRSLEKLLGPLLQDPAPETATMAAVGLLDPFLRELLDVEELIHKYRYNKVEVSSFSSGDHYWKRPRPFVPYENRPQFLGSLKKQLLVSDKFTERQRYIYPILLGQYGVLDAVVENLHKWQISRDKDLQEALLVGPQLSRDVSFLEPLHEAVRNASKRHELRKLLKYLRTTPGQAARNLRREINSRIQSTNPNDY